MEEVGRRASLGLALVLSAFSVSPASAQLVRVPSTTLASAAAPGASILRDSGGRVRRASGLSIAQPGPTPAARARGFVHRFAADLALAPGAELAMHRAIEAHGFDVVRMTRVAHGGPVLGSSIVVRLRADVVDYVAVSGASAPVAGSSPSDLEEASRVALTAVAGAVRATSASRCGLERDAEVVSCALVDLAGVHMHQRWRVGVVAGAVAFARPLALDVLGRVYPEDPISDMDMTSDVPLTGLTSREFLTGRFFRVFSCNAGDRGCEPDQMAVSNVDGDFLYDPVEPAFDEPFAEVNGYHHANRAAEYFRDTHGFTWTCGAETLMQLFVNYAEAPRVPHENAAYSPTSGRDCGFMFFGQGRTRDFVYDSDVVCHEFGHAVVDGTSQLGFFVVDRQGLSYDPGSVNEAVADYFAASINGDPAMAEYFRDTTLGAEGALRNLDNAFVCPDDLVGEVHFDGRIFAGFLWDVHEAIGVEKSDVLVFTSVVSLDTVPSLADATETVLATADALLTSGTIDATDRMAIESAARARGLVGCGRVAPLDGGVTRLAFSGTSDVTGSVGGSIAPVQYRIDIPPDADSLTIDVTDLSARAGEYTIHWGTDGPIRFVASRRPPVIADGSMAAGDALTRSSDPPLPRCQTLYFAIRTDNLATAQQTLYEVTAHIALSGASETCEALDGGPPPVVDAGAEDAGPPIGTPGGGGCTCRATRRRSSGVAQLVLGLLFVALSRRRARL